jgi:hypothetical protein
MINLNAPDSLTVTDESASPHRFHHLVVWRHPRAGEGFASAWAAANDARSALAAFFMRRASIQSDSRLSDSAKQEDVRKAAMDAVREIGNAQRLLNRVTDGSQRERMKLAGIVAATPTDAIVDLDIARHIRSLGESDRNAFLQSLVGGREARAVDAVLRLPAFLTGLTPEMLAVIRAAAVERAHPQDVERLRELDEAAMTAQHALRRASEVLTQGVALELADLMRGYGDAWEHFLDGPRDALAALARRYTETQPA